MKNVWLRDLERAPAPKAKKYIDIRPLTAPENAYEDTHLNEMSQCTSVSRPSTSSEWRQAFKGPHKTGFLEPIHPNKTVSKTKRILRRASREDLKFQSTGPPPGHIAREVAEKREREKELARRRMLRQDTKVFNFTEDIKKMLSFGQFDCKERPEWDQRFIRSHVDKREQALARRNAQRIREKALSSGQNAISVTMRDVLEMYTAPYKIPRGKNACVRAPVRLNDDELHVWNKGRMALHHSGTQIQHKNLQQLATICRKHLRPTHDNIIIVHFLRFVNILLGGTPSFKSAQVILLKDINYLHRLIQNINPLSLPLDYIRAAVTFRMKELEKDGCHFSAESDNQLVECSSDSGGGDDHMSTSQQSSVSHLTQPNSLSEATGQSQHSNSVASDTMGKLSTWEVFIQNLQSWVFSISLLGKIILVSAERTPINILMSQKRKSSNNALTVLQKSVRIRDIKVTNALFTGENEDEEQQIQSQSSGHSSSTPKPETRHRLSVILGISPGSTPFEPYNFVNHMPITPCPEEEVSEEDVNDFRRQFFGVRAPARDFRSLARMSSRSYGDLEVLLKPCYGTGTSVADESIFDDSVGMIEGYLEEKNISSSKSGSSISPTKFGDREHSSVAHTNSCESENYPPTNPGDKRILSDANKYLEVDGTDKNKYRLDKTGNLLVGVGGKFSPSSKNMALYYDMITPGESAEVYVVGSKLETKKLTAVDMCSSSNRKILSDEDIKSELESGETPEEYWQKVKEQKIKENQDFVEALCRLSDLKEDPRCHPKVILDVVA